VPRDFGAHSVDVEDGKVTLDGTVRERRMKHGIEDIAAAARGVDEVENHVRVARADFAEGTFRV
jgi:osmotically-inducible protein OsmY